MKAAAMIPSTIRLASRSKRRMTGSNPSGRMPTSIPPRADSRTYNRLIESHISPGDQKLAQLAVVESRIRSVRYHGQAPAVRSVNDDLKVDLLDRVKRPEPLQHHERGSTGGGLTISNWQSIEKQYAATSRQLHRGRQSTEAGADNDRIPVALRCGHGGRYSAVVGVACGDWSPGCVDRIVAAEGPDLVNAV